MWLKKELELQDWSRDRRRSGWDWLQGKGWQRDRKEGLLVTAVRADGRYRMTERCKREKL